MAYIYEHIRTQGFAPLHFEEHYARLEALSRRVFLAPLAIERSELQKRIGEQLRADGFSPNTANAVTVRCYSDGAVEIECVDILYNSFSLRALHPQAYLCRLSGNLLIENTSAKEAMLELNRTMGQIADEGVALWANELGELLAIDGSPVIAVFDDEIRFSRMGSGVEFDLAYNAVCKMGRNASKQEIRLEELAEAKELLYIDHRGISAVANYGTTVYMDIIAAKIADNIE